MMINRVSLEGRPAGVFARPNDDFRALLRQSPPNLREVDVEAGCNSDSSEVGIIYSSSIAGADRRMRCVLRPVGKNLVIVTRDLTRAIRLIAKADLALRSNPVSKRMVLERLIIDLTTEPKVESPGWMQEQLPV